MSRDMERAESTCINRGHINSVEQQSTGYYMYSPMWNYKNWKSDMQYRKINFSLERGNVCEIYLYWNGDWHIRQS